MNQKNIILQTVGIKKHFGHICALDGIDFHIKEGELVALVGDNGAGKSTFIKILSGVLSPSEGKIVIGEEVLPSLTPHQAISLGISTVYQELALGDTLNVYENLFVGNEMTRRGLLQRKKMKKEAEDLLEELHISIPDVTVPVRYLSGGQRQGIAVARLLYNGGKIFIFDEPTAAMGVKESEAVLKLMRHLVDNGYGVILISHNFPHIFRVADRMYVMRKGKVVAEKKTVETNMEELVSLVTGTTKVEDW